MSVATAEVGMSPLPRRRELLFGTAFAAAGCAMFLLALVGMYLAARSAAGDAWLSEVTIPLTQPNVVLFTFIMSAVTAQWAIYAVTRDDRGHLHLAIGMTMMFGLAVIVQTWFLFTQVGLTVAQSEGGLFYAVTGGHLAMVIGGLLYFAVVGLRALGGSFDSRHPEGVAAAVLFWHVTAALYAVVWLAVYVMK